MFANLRWNKKSKINFKKELRIRSCSCIFFKGSLKTFVAFSRKHRFEGSFPILEYLNEKYEGHKPEKNEIL